MCFVLRCLVFVDIYFFFSSRRRHTRCALVTGVQTCALPILGKALETVGRFAINSTIGAAGVFDVAKKAPINLPYRSNGFANTLGFYGVEPGPYFFLPLVGPTTLRDMVGDGIDLLVLPVSVGKPFNQTAYAVPTTVINRLNDRVARDAEIERLQEESADPYVETRSLYLEKIGRAHV